MRTTAILIFSIVFSAIVAAQSWSAYQSAGANADECGRIITALEKAKIDEGDIIEALLMYTKNSASNRSLVLAAEPIRQDHAKSVKLTDEQIDVLRGRAEKGWRALAVNLFFDAAALASLVFVVAAFVFPSRKKPAPAKRKPVRKVRTDNGE